MSSRECEHGALRRSCERCEDAERIAALEAENACLRGIAAKVMPCHYCGATDISKCPHGHPGCALLDDMWGADECANRALRETRTRLARLTEFARRLWQHSKADFAIVDPSAARQAGALGIDADTPRVDAATDTQERTA